MRRPTTPATVLAALTALLAALLGAVPAAAAAPAPAASQTTAVRGGDVLYSAGGTTCRVGFNARAGGASYGLMPGHCASPGTTWYADAARTVPVGHTAAARFPVDDYGLVRYTNTSLSYPSEVNLGNGFMRSITRAASPYVGQSICQVGRAGGVRCGTVTAVNVTVHHLQGSVHGLFRSSICPEPGDTGGPGFSGSTALGISVGAAGSCATGGSTYHQPVVEILAVYGLSL